MMRDLTLAMPLNNALARDVAAIVQGNQTAAQVVINGTKRAGLPVGIVAAIAIALFALSQNTGIWRERVSPTRGPSTHPVAQNSPGRSVATERAPTLAHTTEALAATAAREDIAIVPESGKRLNDPVLQRGTQPTPSRMMALSPIIARSTPKGATPHRRAAPAVAAAVQTLPAQDRQQVAALTAPSVSAAPVASREPEQSAAYAYHVAAVSDETATSAAVTTQPDTRRRAAVDAIRNLRRQ